MIGGSQFPDLRTLAAEFPQSQPPKGWRWHSVGEVLFLIGFFAVVIICGGGG